MITRLRAAAAARLTAARARQRHVDHLVRAVRRYDDARGSQHAGAVTYFGFLALFPLLALAFAILGYLIGWLPDLYTDVAATVADALPGMVGTEPGQVNIDQIVDARAGAGVFGILGLLSVGTAWVEALQESLRPMWLQRPTPAGNILARKVRSTAMLVLIGTSLLVSIGLSAITTIATGSTVEVLQLPQGAVVSAGLRVVTVTVAVVGSSVLFAVMFWQLSGMHMPRRRLAEGAVLAGVGFEVLKLSATWLLGNTMRNPVYVTFAVAVGTLVWINLVARVTLMAAAWTATQAYSDAGVGTPRVPAESRDPGRGRSAVGAVAGVAATGREGPDHREQ